MHGELSITHFLHMVKSLVDELITVDRPLSTQGFNICVSWKDGVGGEDRPIHKGPQCL